MSSAKLREGFNRVRLLNHSTVIALLGLISLSETRELFADTIFPAKTWKLARISERTRKAVDARWEEDGALEPQFSLSNRVAECRIFESYTLALLRKLITASSLESSAQDFYFSMNCYNLNQHPLGALVLGRTLEINQGYFAALESEDAFVALLAHELSHHILRHEDRIEPELRKVKPAEGSDMSEIPPPSAQEMKIQKMILRNEREADQNSVAILANAGYSYLGALDLLNAVGKIRRFRASATHDSFEARKDLILTEAQRLNLREGAKRPFPDEILDARRAYFEEGRPYEGSPRLPKKKVLVSSE